jgi:hypothetical protein
MPILRLIDGSDAVQEERLLQILLRTIKTVAEKGLGREPVTELASLHLSGSYLIVVVAGVEQRQL